MSTSTSINDNHVDGRRKRHSRYFVLAILLGIALCTALIVPYVIKFGTQISDQQDTWGQFGDYLGGLLNPIFGFAGFLILLATLHAQRVQIDEERAQNAQLQSHQKLELEEERKRFAEEHAARIRESFEATFFQLLSRFSEVVADIRYSYRDVLQAPPSPRYGPIPMVTLEGRPALRAMFEGFKRKYKSAPRQNAAAARAHYVNVYVNFFRDDQDTLGIYFRTLYHIFKFVDTEKRLPLEQRTRYANIARAQLSSSELAMIFYNGLFGEGLNGFEPLIRKYGILKHVQQDALLEPSDISDRNLYREETTANFSRRLEIWGGTEPEISYD